MNELTLAQLFGVNASQDGQNLFIDKSDLPLLTPSANNTAESLLVAILLKALENFAGTLTDENNQPITDELNQPITFDNSDAYELLKIINWKPFQLIRNGQKYINHQIIVFQYAKN